MGDERRGRRRARRLGSGVRLRDAGRKMALLASADILLSLLLPWIQRGEEGLNAFELGSPMLLWVAIAIWPILVMALAAGVLALVDRVRSLGRVIGVAEILLGCLVTGLAGEILATIVILRQVGVVAMGVGGLLLICSGAVLLKAPWTPSPRARESVFAHPERLPWVSITLVAANVVTFLALAFRDDYTTAVIREWGLIGGSVRWYAPVTSMFLPAGWCHLISNAAVLVAVGARLERRAGRPAFTAIYLVSGVAGALLSALVDPRTSTPLVGASGGVAGLLAACAALAPRARLRVWFYAVVTASRIELGASWLFAGWFALQALGGFYLAIGSTDTIAYWGHIGGVVVGLAAGVGLRAAGLAQVAEKGGGEVGSTTLSPPRGEAEGEGEAETDNGSAGTIPAGRRPRKARTLDMLPHVLVAVCILLSLVSVALTFTSGSMIGALSRFERAWNSGRLEDVEAMLRPESRDRMGTWLRGRSTDFLIALRRAERRDDDCLAAFVTAKGGGDPYRAQDGEELRAIFRRSDGRWWLRTIRMPSVD